MIILYNIIITLFFIILSPFIAITYLFNLKDIRRRFNSFRKLKPLKKCVWIHGASLGEQTLIKKLLPRFKNTFPEFEFIITSTTTAGLDYISGHTGDDVHTAYLPPDFYWIVKTAVKKQRPEIFINLETEIWPNLLLRIKKSGINAFLLNARLSAKSTRRYRWASSLIQRVLSAFALIVCQENTGAKRFRSLGYPDKRIKISGNLKNEICVSTVSAEEKRSFREISGISSKAKLFTIGSLREGETRSLLLPAMRSLLFENSEIIIAAAPRHISKVPFFDKISAENGISSVKWSEHKKSGEKLNSGLLLIDTLGELNNFYRISDAAFVGGTMSDYGGHNLIEPLNFGVPVIFGPYYYKQKVTAEILKNSGCGILCRDKEALESILEDFKENGPVLNRVRKNIAKFKEKQGDDTDNVFRLIRKKYKKSRHYESA
ncbi:MAG: 3-deoxy-D-manno-octulosonic acid transferase [Fibrobacterota bacterium]